MNTLDLESRGSGTHLTELPDFASGTESVIRSLPLQTGMWEGSPHLLNTTSRIMSFVVLLRQTARTFFKPGK